MTKNDMIHYVIFILIFMSFADQSVECKFSYNCNANADGLVIFYSNIDDYKHGFS